MKHIALFLMMLTSALSASTFTFDLLPQNGSISGTAGSTIGWGYSITNDSSDQWLVTSDLNMGTFVWATPNILFDFPILAPGTTVTQAYDPVAGKGLVELILSGSISAPVVNSGAFELAAQWWDGDPFAGGSYVEDVAPAMRGYRAIAAPAPVPEPSTAALALLGLAALGVSRVRKRA